MLRLYAGRARPVTALRCRINPYLDQGGACGAASGAPRAGLSLSEACPARPRRPEWRAATSADASDT